MSDFSYETAPERFIDVVPELRNRYQELLEEWEGEMPGPTIVFDDIISPHIMDLLRSPQRNHDRLKAIFSFLEEMAVHEDRNVRNLLAVTVCEHILGSKAIYTTARSLIGPATQRLAHATATSKGFID